jgi:hypothetical protein
MTQTYRTDDFARWGAGQGFDLSPAQVDINFWDMVQRMIAQEARPDPAPGIDHFVISGINMYVHMTDGTVLGPYVLPVAVYRSRGDWQPETPYSALDTVANNGGLYAVVIAHTSALTFDPGASDGSGNDYYSLMIQTPGSALPSGGAVGMVLEKSTTVDYATTWGYKLPEDGNAREYLIKLSTAQQDADWGEPNAADIGFVPATGSALTADTVADALEELAESGFSGSAADVEYTPNTGSGLTDDNVQDALNTLGAAVADTTPIGRQTMWVPATAMTPRLTNGPTPGLIEVTSNKNIIKTLNFDATTQQFAQFDIAMPKSWDEGVVYYKVYWSNPSTSSVFGVVWGLDAVSVSNGYFLDTNFGTTIYVNDTGGSFDTMWISPQSAALTVGGFTPEESYVQFRISRVPADSLDTMTVVARLHGIQLYYNTNIGTDD